MINFMLVFVCRHLYRFLGRNRFLRLHCVFSCFLSEPGGHTLGQGRGHVPPRFTCCPPPPPQIQKLAGKCRPIWSSYFSVSENG